MNRVITIATAVSSFALPAMNTLAAQTLPENPQRAVWAVATAASAVEQATNNLDKVVQQLDSLAEFKRHHDANRCVYPPGNPEVCRWYDEQGRRGAERQKELEALYKLRRDQKHYAETRFGVLLAALRIRNFLEPYKTWRNNMVAACGNLNNTDAAGCYLDHWQNLPRGDR